jgi:hypothetical protein
MMIEETYSKLYLRSALNYARFCFHMKSMTMYSKRVWREGIIAAEEHIGEDDSKFNLACLVYR